MATVSGPPPVRHGSCKLLISINEQLYTVRRRKALTRHGKVWTLKKPDGTMYTCTWYDRESACDCPDARRRNATCKHIQALRAAGLMPRRVIRKAVPHV